MAFSRYDYTEDDEQIKQRIRKRYQILENAPFLGSSMTTSRKSSSLASLNTSNLLIVSFIPLFLVIDSCQTVLYWQTDVVEFVSLEEFDESTSIELPDGEHMIWN